MTSNLVGDTRWEGMKNIAETGNEPAVTCDIKKCPSLIILTGGCKENGKPGGRICMYLLQEEGNNEKYEDAFLAPEV